MLSKVRYNPYCLNKNLFSKYMNYTCYRNNKNKRNNWDWNNNHNGDHNNNNITDIYINNNELTTRIEDHNAKKNYQKHNALKILTPNKNPYVVDKELDEQINHILFMSNPKIKGVVEYYEKLVNLHDLNKRNYVLLYGPPGCGKTHLASHLSLKSNMGLVALNLSNIKSQWVGEEPKSLNKCLTDIDNYFNDSIIIIDEIDTMMCKRKYDSVSARDSAASVNILLSWMDGINTTNDNRLIIFTTNNKKELDNAFLDRITYKIKIKHLSREQMYGYWKSHLKYMTQGELTQLSNLHFKSFRTANNVLKNCVMNKIKAKNYNSYLSVDDVVVEYKKITDEENQKINLEKYLI